MTKTYDLSRKFIYRNARPLDLARFRYHFEGGSCEAVIDALSAYQNDDGGFGHGLEPDCLNPYSSPLQVWKATEILHEIGFDDAKHPIISGILRYLESGHGVDKESGLWRSTTPENNDHPHAIWWSYNENEDGAMRAYNPTAALAGFIIRFADTDGALYERGLELAHRAFDWFEKSVPFGEKHSLSCFIRLYEYLCASEAAKEFDMPLFKKLLEDEIRACICADISKWNKEYVAMPSDFIETKNSVGYEENKELIGKECELLLLSQEADGGRAVTFRWCTDYKEQELAYNRWRAEIVIKSELYLRNFGSC